MKYSKSAIGLLTREYRSVLKKCLLINLGLFALGAIATPANAEYTEAINIQNNTDANINEDVDIKNLSGHGILVSTPNALDTGSTLTINADSVKVEAGRAAIWSQHRTENGPNNDPTKISITANTINLKGYNGGGGANTRSSDGYGVVTAMSQGVVELKGNTTITANPALNNDAILARGNAVVKINENATTETTVINGNIDFNYNNTDSGSTVNAVVDVTLKGEDSVWNGNTVMSYDTIAKPEKMHQNETTIRLEDGAIWNASQISDVEETTDGGYFYTTLNNLNANNANVNIADTTRGISVQNLKVGANGITVNNGTMHVTTSVDTRNGVIDTGLDNIEVSENGAKLYVDADLSASTKDEIAIATGKSAVIDAITVLGGGASTNKKQSINFGDNVSFSDAAVNAIRTATGHDVTVSGGEITFTQADEDADAFKLGDWTNGNYIQAYNDATSATTSLGANVQKLDSIIAALDDAMGTMVLNTENKNFVKRDDSGEIVIDETTGEPVALTNATDALNALDAVIGNITDLEDEFGNLSNFAPEGSEGIAAALDSLDKTLGKIHGLANEDGTVNHASSNFQTSGNTNLAKGTTASDHLVSLDNAIGDRQAYNNADNFTGYVAHNDGSKDLTTMISEVASNIGKAGDIRSTNQISAQQTVNANLSSLDAAIGNVDALSEELGATDLTSAINNLNTKVNESNGAFSKAINKLDMDQRKLRHDFEAGMAGQAALSALVPNAKASGNTQLAVGTGAYKGHTAAAVGGFHWFTDNLLFNAGVAWDNNEATGRMGITYSW